MFFTEDDDGDFASPTSAGGGYDNVNKYLLFKRVK